MLIGTVACRITNRAVYHLRLASVLLASEAATHQQCAVVHSKGTEQLTTFRTVGSPASRSMAPKFDAAADSLSAGFSAHAGTPCSISRPWELVPTAAASFATYGSTRGAAVKTSKLGRWSSKGRSAKLINVDITSCASIQQLQQLVQQDGAHMDHINLSAAVVKLQKLLSNLDSQQQQQVIQQSASLLDQLWQLQQSRLLQCGAWSLSNMIYSICLLPAPLQQQYQWVVAQHLLPAFMRQISTAKPQGVSNVLYSMAASGQQLPEQTTKLLINALVAALRNANTQDIANALWGVAKMQQQIQPLASIKRQVEQGQLEQLLCAFVMQLREASPQEVSNTLLACAEFRYLPKKLLAAPGAVDKLAADNPQGLANTAWACGQLGYRDVQLMAALLNRVLAFVDTSTCYLDSRGVTEQTLANLCWSLAVLDLREHAPAVLTLVQAGKSLWASMAPEGLRQLYQVHMWLIDHNLAGGQGLAGVLTAQQLQQCQSTWHQSLKTTARVGLGATQQSVFTTLQDILIPKWLVPPAMEQVSLGPDGQPDGAALIDITARTADGLWLAVEVDGPTHFRRPDGGLVGPTLFRNRALAVRDYALISVPYYEWDVQHSSKLKQQYLLDKVTAAVQQAAVNRPRLQLEEAAQSQGTLLQHQTHANISSSQSRSVGCKLSQLNTGDRSNAAGHSFDPAKTVSRASISADSLGSTRSQDGRVRRARHKKELPET